MDKMNCTQIFMKEFDELLEKHNVKLVLLGNFDDDENVGRLMAMKMRYNDDETYKILLMGYSSTDRDFQECVKNQKQKGI